MSHRERGRGEEREQQSDFGMRAESKRLRLFVAINLPDAVKVALQKCQEEFTSQAGKGPIRWMREDQLHLTLKFLGYVPENSAAQIEKELRGACGGIAPFRLMAEGMGCFPNVRAPRVIWVGIREAGTRTNHDENGPTRLLTLQKQIERAMIAWAEPEKRAFTPHLTLGRLKDPPRKQVQAIAQLAEANKSARFGEWEAREVDLMHSVLSSSGAAYRCLASIRLV
jgi:2'-5' RNA ligase